MVQRCIILCIWAITHVNDDEHRKLLYIVSVCMQHCVVGSLSTPSNHFHNLQVTSIRHQLCLFRCSRCSTNLLCIVRVFTNACSKGTGAI